MPIHLQEELNANGGLGFWSICDGRFHVWDRGDGYAEVTPASPSGSVSPQLARRAGISVGFPVFQRIGIITGNQSAGPCPVSAFPGHFKGEFHLHWIAVPVPTINDLEETLQSV